MTPRRPSLAELSTIADLHQLALTSFQLESMHALMDPYLASYLTLDSLDDSEPSVSFPRGPAWHPPATDNELGGWAARTEIRGSTTGLLVGRTLAIKDNICVAGVPMTNGTHVFDGHIAAIDATVVSRVLEAGGTILGKASCESFCLSGGSHTNEFAPVRNPYDPTRSAGGSSGGSAVLLAAEAVDLAIGCDQGGSIRIPCAWCGVYGLKPTFGLVPYTGIFPIDMTLDHVGPMARNVSDLALLLQVIAGPDGLDPRQNSRLRPADYLAEVGAAVDGLRVGLVDEGFGLPGAEPDVEDLVMSAAKGLSRLGIHVVDLSIPWHLHGSDIWNAIAVEGVARFMIDANATGYGWRGYYPLSLLDAYARARTSRSATLPPTVQLFILLGDYMHRHYYGRYYAKAQNLARRLRKAYDDAFEQVDVFVMPTVPFKARSLPATDCTLDQYVQRASEPGANTCPFNVSGHPALNVPVGTLDGLPVGMMLVGRWGDEGTLIRLASALEQNYPPPHPPMASRASACPAQGNGSDSDSGSAGHVA